MLYISFTTASFNSMSSDQNPYGVAPNSTGGQQVVYAQAKNNGLAIASLILGILSFFLWIFSAIPGIITGHMALSRAKHRPNEYSGEGMAIVGLILSYIMLIVSVLLFGWIGYMFSTSPEIKDAFMQGFTQGMTGQYQTR